MRRLIELSPRLPWAVLLMVIVAELLTLLLSPGLGLLIHALLLLALLARGVSGAPGPEQNLLLALALVPLIRLLSLSLPLPRLPQLAWYPMIAVPLLISAWITARMLGVSRAQLGLRSSPFIRQAAVACSGLGIGVIEYRILKPEALIANPSWPAYLAAALILIVFTGFAEELVFRGLLLSVAWPAMGRSALVYVSLLFAAMHIGYHSLPDLLLVFTVGAFFGFVARSTGSILGVALAHGLTNVTMYLVMPALADGAAIGMVGGLLLIVSILSIVPIAVAVPVPRFHPKRDRHTL
jgi:uncharacterized protein